jgi:hypothetical protein
MVGCQLHSPAALPQERDIVPIVLEVGGPQGRSGRVRKISPPPAFDPIAIPAQLTRLKAQYSVLFKLTRDPIWSLTHKITLTGM